MKTENTMLLKKRRGNFTAISNRAIRDKRMSLAVRGLFALMMSLPENREYKVAYFCKVGDIGKDTVYRYFGILEEYGYLKRSKTYRKDGKFGVNSYLLDDDPDTPCPGFPDTAKPDAVLPDTEMADSLKKTVEKNIPPKPPKGGQYVKSGRVRAEDGADAPVKEFGYGWE